MHRFLRRAARDRVGWLAALCLPVCVARAAPLTLEIDAAAPGTPVSPMLYGAFFEEINRAGDGGLYAEMLQNRSFEDAPEPVAWTLLNPAGADATWNVDVDGPLNSNNPHRLRLNVVDPKGGRVGISNEGFKGTALLGKQANEKSWTDWLPKFAAAAAKSVDGINVHANAQYHLSFYARAAGDAKGPWSGTVPITSSPRVGSRSLTGFKGPLSATLERPDGTVLARAEFTAIGPDWMKFDAVLQSSGDETNARLVLAVTSPVTLWLDMVSLFPAATFKNRPTGLRPDLAGMLAGLRPAFLRFPGGSFVEGLMLVDAYRWKRTIGDVAARPGFQGIWGYRSTDGLGFHEYLQLCEDLGAAPLYVANCGMSEKEFAPPDKMAEWTQDALDAIEYANGPVTSRWGAERARNGHPAPFELRYVEIGNENGLSYSWGGGNKAQYTERYRPIYQAIKAHYPEIMTIANSPVDAPVEILDEHYYNNSEWFQAKANLYDSYDRRGPKIYVGEYAVTKGCGNGNLKAALGEAAFMTGMERNADVVTMSSYAPLFANPAWKRWHPDAVFFNASQVYATPSYHAQAMFAANRADVSLPLKIGGGQALFAVAGRQHDTGEVILKVVNPGKEPLSVMIHLRGAGAVAPAARALVLASTSDNDENSFASPGKVQPREETFAGAANDFGYEFPAYSITILRLSARKKL